MQKNYIRTLLIIEVQIILLLMIFLAFKSTALENKLKRTNIFIAEIFKENVLEAVHLIDKNDIVIGDENSPVTMIVYSKYNCSACEDFYTSTYPKLIEDYIEKGILKVIVRYLTHESNPVFFYSVQCARYAHQNDVFDQYNEAIHEFEYTELDIDKIKNLTLNLIPSSPDLEQYTENQEVAGQISTQALNARKAGITRTPTFIINGTQIIGNRRYKKFEQLIAAASK